jgi:hypothetical protein
LRTVIGLKKDGDHGNMLIYDLNANPLNSNEWAFPLTECFHITSFALSIGTIVFVDLKLLGVALKRHTAAQALKDTSGLIIVILSGLMIFSSDPIMYLHNASFRYKVSNLLLAIVFNYTVHRTVALRGVSPGGSKGNGNDSALPLIGLSAVYIAYLAAFLTTAGSAVKVGVFILAILANLAIQFVVPLSGSSAQQKTAGAMSLAMWVSVVYGGLWIAFV